MKKERKKENKSRKESGESRKESQEECGRNEKKLEVSWTSQRKGFGSKILEAMWTSWEKEEKVVQEMTVDILEEFGGEDDC